MTDEARLATPGSDVRTLLAQMLHENKAVKPFDGLLGPVGCVHSTDGAWKSCEVEAELLAATPSGKALARLATPGSDVLDAAKAVLGHWENGIGWFDGFNGTTRGTDYHLTQMTIEDEEEMSRRMEVLGKALARLATAGPGEPAERNRMGPSYRLDSVPLAITQEPATDAGREMVRFWLNGRTHPPSTQRLRDFVDHILAIEAAGPSEPQDDTCANSCRCECSCCEHRRDAPLVNAADKHVQVAAGPSEREARLEARLGYASRVCHSWDPEHTGPWEECRYRDCIEDRAALTEAT